MTTIRMTPLTQAALILLTCGAAIHLGGQSLRTYLLRHPALQVLHRDPPAQSAALRTGAINVIKEDSPLASAPTTPSTITSDLPNRLFTTPGASKTSAPSTPIAPDYFARLIAENRIQISALMRNGAIINKHFHTVGDRIDAIAYPAPGEDSLHPSRTTAPTLHTVGPHFAVIRESVAPHRIHRLVLE